VSEGDVLQVGNDVTVRLVSVSPVLKLDDHRGLAEFFERVGERRTARTLRGEPRLTEEIISFSLTNASSSFPPPTNDDADRWRVFSRRSQWPPTVSAQGAHTGAIAAGTGLLGSPQAWPPVSPPALSEPAVGQSLAVPTLDGVDVNTDPLREMALTPSLGSMEPLDEAVEDPAVPIGIELPEELPDADPSDMPPWESYEQFVPASFSSD